jgi:hypothetical protein
MFGEMGFQRLLLHDGQVALTLAVVLQAEKRQSRSGKGKSPFRQNCRANIQNPANRSGVFSCVQKKERTRTFPNKGINFAAAAKRFKRYALLVG